MERTWLAQFENVSDEEALLKLIEDGVKHTSKGIRGTLLLEYF